MSLFSYPGHPDWDTMAGLAHYLTLDSIQVPLDLKRHKTLAIVGVGCDQPTLEAPSPALANASHEGTCGKPWEYYSDNLGS